MAGSCVNPRQTQFKTFVGCQFVKSSLKHNRIKVANFVEVVSYLLARLKIGLENILYLDNCLSL